MSGRFFFYYINVIRPILIGRYNYINSLQVVNFNKIVLNITLDDRKDIKDLRILYSMFLVELLAFKRPFIKVLKSVYRAKTKSLIIVINLDLNNFDVYRFLDFFLFYCLPALHHKYVDLIAKYNFSNAIFYSLSFSEVTNLLDIPPLFYK